MRDGNPDAVAAADYPPGRQAWAAVLILLLLYIVSMLDRNIITLFADNIRADLGLSDVELGLLFGPAFALSYALGALPFGWAMDRYSRRTVLWVGVTIWSLATVASGLSRTFVQLFASRAFIGAGEAVLVPGNQSILADSFPPDRLAFPIAIYSLGSRIGQGSSLILGGLLAAIVAPGAYLALPLLGTIKGWQLIFILVGLPGALLALLIFLIPEPPRRRSAGGKPSDVTLRAYLEHAWKNARFFVGLHVGATIAIVVATALAVWTPAFFVRVHEWPVEKVGLWLGIAIVAGPVIGTPLHGLIADRRFRRGIDDAPMRHLVTMVLCAIVPLAAGYLVSYTWLGLALICLGQGLLIATTVLMPTSLQLMVPGEMRGKAASFMLIATAVGGVSLGPAIAATISESLLGGPAMIGVSLAIMVGAGLPLAALFFAIALRPLAAAYARRP